MARQPQRKTINGHDWEVTPWDGMHGVKMQARIGRILGKVGPALGGAGLDNLMDADVGAVIAAIADQLDETETPRLIRDMLHGTFVEGKDVTMDRVFNDHFAANYAELYEGLAYVLQVNCGELFQLVADNTGDRTAATGQAEKVSRAN